LLVSSMASPSPVIVYRVRDALEEAASQAQVALSHQISRPAWRFGHGIRLTAVNNFRARGHRVTCRQHLRGQKTSLNETDWGRRPTCLRLPNSRSVDAALERRVRAF
jgi:hypothetical protein